MVTQEIWECDPCEYHKLIHSYGSEEAKAKLEKCKRCLKPLRDRMSGNGIYPRYEGGEFKLEG